MMKMQRLYSGVEAGELQRRRYSGAAALKMRLELSSSSRRNTVALQVTATAAGISRVELQVDSGEQK